MPPRSTAKHLAYDLRPAKQAERLIILDVLKAGGDIGLPITKYRYVGMGANRFYDFILVHKYLGLKSMISLEHDPKMFSRAQFNAPYSFIDVRPDDAAAFIAADDCEPPSVNWFDYDGGIGPRTLRDIADLGVKLKVGDFFFVTVFGGPSKVLASLNDAGRLAWLNDNMGGVAGDVNISDVETSSFPDAVHKMLLAAFKNAFSVRRDGKFFILLQVEYSDSTPMITVGGAFLSDESFVAIKKRMASTLPFLKVGKDKLYRIRSLNLTERERALFDRAVTKPKKRSSERNTIQKLGFSEADFSSYGELIRFLPRYVETMV